MKYFGHGLSVIACMFSGAYLLVSGHAWAAFYATLLAWVIADKLP